MGEFECASHDRHEMMMVFCIFICDFLVLVLVLRKRAFGLGVFFSFFGTNFLLGFLLSCLSVFVL